MWENKLEKKFLLNEGSTYEQSGLNSMDSEHLYAKQTI